MTARSLQRCSCTGAASYLLLSLHDHHQWIVSRTSATRLHQATQISTSPQLNGSTILSGMQADGQSVFTQQRSSRPNSTTLCLRQTSTRIGHHTINAG